MGRFIVHQFRAGAPDKFNLKYDKFLIDLKKHDNQNLADWDNNKIYELAFRGDYFLPADEGDIKKANSLMKVKIDPSNHVNKKDVQRKILLPKTVDEVIDYDKFVPKNSKLYSNLSKATGVGYMSYYEYPDIDAFLDVFSKKPLPEEKAIKTATGSGSRGVVLNTRNPERLRLGGKYDTVDSLDHPMMKSFIEFARKEKCAILTQNFIPLDGLTKINVDFIIRTGNLISYKWDVVDPNAVFTNWNWLYVISNEYTDTVMSNLTNFLTRECHITDAIMNFEAFSDNKSETILVEFNWRYSNSMFEWGAFDIDPLVCYLTNTQIRIPSGEYKLNRYWTAGLYSELKYYDYK